MHSRPRAQRLSAECSRASCVVLPHDYKRFFGFLVCYTATQLANQLHQTRIQVVCSNKVARKRMTESNGTPAMDLGHMNVVLKQYSQSHLG